MHYAKVDFLFKARIVTYLNWISLIQKVHVIAGKT